MTKAGQSYCVEAVHHRFRGAGLRTVLAKPGVVRTGMTAGLKEPPFAGEPEQVARIMLNAIDRGQPQVYTPWVRGW